MSETVKALAVVIAWPTLLWTGGMALLHGRCFEMDAHARYSFYAILALYRRLSFTLFGVGVLVGLESAYLRLVTVTIATLSAAIYSLLFQVWLTWCYELYLHQRYREGPSGTLVSLVSSYTGFQYAVTLALGLSALVLFIVGLVGFAWALLTR